MKKILFIVLLLIIGSNLFASVKFTGNPAAGEKLAFANEGKKTVFIFEKQKDVAYLGCAGSDFINIPKDMPKGKYKVYYFSGNDTKINSVNINISSDYTEKTTKLKPIAYGFYKGNDGVYQPWYSNQSHTLYWNGEPFMVVSGMLIDKYLYKTDMENAWEDFVYDMDIMEKHGLKHIYLYTGRQLYCVSYERWNRMISYLENKGFTYTIGNPWGQIENWPAPTQRIIRANSDITKIDRDQKGIVYKEIKCTDYTPVNYGICQADAILMDSNNVPFEVRPCRIYEADEDSYNVKIRLDLSDLKEPCNVTYSVRLVTNASYGNPWKNSVQQINYVRDNMKNLKLGPGFRGFIDMILPNERGIHINEESYFIDAKEFLEDRADRLLKKYANIGKLKKAWQSEGAFVSSVSEASLLYPVYNDGKYIYLAKTVPYESPDRLGKNGSYFWSQLCDDFRDDVMKEIDRENTLFSKEIYKIKSTSPYWTEFIQMREESLRDIQNNIADEIKRTVNVPIAIKSIAGCEIYNTVPEKNRSGFDILGNELYHSGEFLLNHGAGFRFGEIEASNKAMIGHSTEINRMAGRSMYPNYPDIQGFFYDMAVTHHLGAKSTYIFTLKLCFDDFPNNNSIKDERMLEWMKLWEEIINDKKEIIEDFKTYYYNSWPRLDLWWASVSERKAVRNTDDAYGMQNIKAPNGVWVINNFRSDLPCDITFVTLHDKPATEYYKEEFENLVNKHDREIIMCGLRKDIGTLSVDKYYKNEFFYDDIYAYQVLNVPEGAEIIHESDGKVWAMKIGDLQIVACQPKYCNSIEDTVQFAKLPEVRKTGLDAKSYLNDMLGVRFATYGNSLIKAAEYKLGGKDTVAFHTTQPEGGNTVEIKIKKDCHFYQFCTYKETDLKAGTVFKITFPETDYTDKTIGAGKGTVKLTDITFEDIEFIGLAKDTLLEKNENGFEINSLPKGMAVPHPKKITALSDSNIENQKAFAGFNYGLSYYEKGDYYKAEEIWREYIGLCRGDVFTSMCLGLGNCNLIHGHSVDAYNYYTDALREDPDSKDLKTALGCMYFKEDISKSKKLWEEAGTEEAKTNLKLIDSSL